MSQCVKFWKTNVEVSPQERISEGIGDQIVDVPVPQISFVEMVNLSPYVQVQQHTARSAGISTPAPTIAPTVAMMDNLPDDEFPQKPLNSCISHHLEHVNSRKGRYTNIGHRDEVLTLSKISSTCVPIRLSKFPVTCWRSRGPGYKSLVHYRH